ncbi:hypothetical protein GVN24_23285 [Rhizobium sp. CRIBSB]|nr:hypothetical protein [Rhizobium sp. CRIBSB]
MALVILKAATSLIALHALFWIVMAWVHPRWFNAAFWQYEGDGVSRARGDGTLGTRLRFWSCILGTVVIGVFASEAFLWWMPQAWGSYSEGGEFQSLKNVIRAGFGFLSLLMFPLLTRHADEIYASDQRTAAEELSRERLRDF